MITHDQPNDVVNFFLIVVYLTLRLADVNAPINFLEFSSHWIEILMRLSYIASSTIEALRRCETLWSAREIASMALTAEQARYTENVFHIALSLSRWADEKPSDEEAIKVWKWQIKARRKRLLAFDQSNKFSLYPLIIRVPHESIALRYHGYPTPRTLLTKPLNNNNNNNIENSSQNAVLPETDRQIHKRI